MELLILLIEVVALPALAHPLGGRLGFDVEHDRQMRDQPLGGPPAQRQDGLLIEVATGGLVGDGRVDVAVGDDDVSLVEIGVDQGRHMVGTVGGEEQRLRARARTIGVEQDRTDLRSQFGSAGLPGGLHVIAVIGQGAGDPLDLGGLSRPVPAFDGDEESRAESLGGVAESAGGVIVLIRWTEAVDDVDRQTLQFVRVEGEESDDAGDESRDSEDDISDVAGGEHPIRARPDSDASAEVEGVDDDGQGRTADRSVPAGEVVGLSSHADADEECDRRGQDHLAGELRDGPGRQQQHAGDQQGEGRYAGP